MSQDSIFVTHALIRLIFIGFSLILRLFFHILQTKFSGNCLLFRNFASDNTVISTEITKGSVLETLIVLDLGEKFKKYKSF